MSTIGSDISSERQGALTRGVPSPEPWLDPNVRATGSTGIQAGIHPLYRRTAKRAADVIFAVLMLVLAAPLLLVIAAAILISSHGPVLYRQTRIGWWGRPFAMLKFRTMCDGAHELRSSLEHLNESSGTFKLRDDPRVTRVGCFLRRTSLDELPQLVNVLRGQMSLVGPRPLVPEEDRLIDGEFRERLQVRPGMTGRWQTLGPIRPPLRQMVVIDCLYVEQWSLWEDLRILARTLVHVARLRGV